MSKKCRKVNINKMILYIEENFIKSIVWVILISLIIIVLAAFIMQLIVNCDIRSGASNDGWISFYGGIIGGVLGSIGATFAVLITTMQAKNHQSENLNVTRQIQSENMEMNLKLYEESVRQIEISNANEFIKDLREKCETLNKCHNILKKVEVNKMITNIEENISFNDFIKYSRVVSELHTEFLKNSGSIGTSDMEELDTDILNQINGLSDITSNTLDLYTENIRNMYPIIYDTIRTGRVKIKDMCEKLKRDISSAEMKIILKINTISEKKYSYMKVTN